MTRNAPIVSADLVASHALLALAATQIVTREWYHRAGAETINLGLVCVCWVLLVIGAIATRIAVPELRRRFVYRIALVASAAMAGHFMFAGWIGAGLARGAQQSFWRFAELLTLAAVGVALLRVRPDRWLQFRKLLLVVASLFVVSQPLLTSAMVDEVVWPSPRQPAPPASAAPIHPANMKWPAIAADATSAIR